LLETSGIGLGDCLKENRSTIRASCPSPIPHRSASGGKTEYKTENLTSVVYIEGVFSKSTAFHLELEVRVTERLEMTLREGKE